MRIYQNCKDTASEVKRDLAEMGVEVQLHTMQDKQILDNPEYVTNELIGYSYMITNPSDKEELMKAFKKEHELPWAEAEFAERINQKKVNPGEAYKMREVWEEFVHDGKFAYSYSERIGDQVEKVIAMLKKTPSSRNAIVSIWDPTIDIDRIGGVQRVPCSMYYQFLIRNGELNLIYTMRSNDLITHWCHDIYLAITLQQYVAKKLNLPVGNFIQFVGSLHTYKKDLKGVF